MQDAHLQERPELHCRVYNCRPILANTVRVLARTRLSCCSFLQPSVIQERVEKHEHEGGCWSAGVGAWASSALSLCRCDALASRAVPA